MRRSILLLGAAAALGCGGGGGSGANFPGRGDVDAAHAAWCDALGKLAGAGTWEHLADCKAAHTTASAPYLRGMTKCYVARVEAAGDGAVDSGAITAECNEQVAVELNLDEAMGRDVIAARCERMQKCEKVEPADCKAGVDKLESAQKVMLTTTYNPPALAEIADCLRSMGCSENEEGVRDACYDQQSRHLLWFPGG